MTEPTPTSSTNSGNVAVAGGSKRMSLMSETVTLLRAVVEFQQRTGSALTASTMAGFLESSSASLPSHLSDSRVKNKLRHLRHKHKHSLLPSSSPEDHLIKRLCSQVWGSSPVDPIAPKEEDSDDDDGEDDGTPVVVEEYPCLLDAVGKHCSQKGFNVGPFKEVLGMVGRSKMVALEEKWRRHWYLKMETEKKRLELSKELLNVLVAAEKGSG